MTLVAPPPAPPAERPTRQRRRTSARSLVLVVLGALVLAALLNPDDQLKRARQQPFGWQRDVAVRVAEVNRDVSRTLLLNQPRRGLDHLFGKDTGSGSTGPAPQPSTQPTAGPGPTPSSSVSPSSSPAAARTPTASDPLRVFLVGDSVMGAVSEAFDHVASSAKVVKPTTEFRYSTGLSRPDYFDWPARLSQITKRSPRPEAIVVMFGANDVQPIMTPSGPAKAGSAKWLSEYRRRVASTIQMLSGSGIPVVWVGQPLMRSDLFTKRIGLIWNASTRVCCAVCRLSESHRRANSAPASSSVQSAVCSSIASARAPDVAGCGAWTPVRSASQNPNTSWMGRVMSCSSRPVGLQGPAPRDAHGRGDGPAALGLTSRSGQTQHHFQRRRTEGSSSVSVVPL
jgi:hypothetical protein